MIRNFPEACQKCPNFQALNECGDQLEELEEELRQLENVEIIEEGSVTCWGGPDRVIEEDGEVQRICCYAVKEPVLPKLRLTLQLGSGALSKLVSINAKVEKSDDTPKIDLIGMGFNMWGRLGWDISPKLMSSYRHEHPNST